MGDLSEMGGKMKQPVLTEEEITMVRENVEQNLVRVADANPGTTFYLFLPPYSIAAWGMFYGEGNVLRYIEAQEIAAGMLTACDNVRLYSFSTDTDIVCDFDNYADRTHFTEEINSMILREMAKEDSRYRLTEDDTEAYLAEMKELYLQFDYSSLANE